MDSGTADSSSGGGGGGTDGHAEKLMEDEGEHADSPSSSSTPSSSSSSSSSSTIEVHLRIRPSPNPSTYHEIDDLDRSTLIFTVPADHRAAATTAAASSSAANIAATTSKGGYVDNTRTRYAFKFNSILEPSTSQATVFKDVGIPAILNALEGYNSTVFAYGQTGSGKTHTMTGGPDHYDNRGVILRAITMLFEEFARRSETAGASYNCYISYLELYNESGYDLLAQKASTSLHEVPKVTMLEDEDGNCHFGNLSIHPATSEEEALNLLFLGDTNRAIFETEMNQSSSRSHCIFTIMIECRPGDGAAEVGTLIKSKLNLVDLSGSERVHKTSSTGQTLAEAKYINSSLFFLEMVIVALHEKASGRGGTTTHIPYRNSMMTSVLRESLGGSCKTVMIATMSPEAAQVSESISTCQFAQRVALVRNTAEINEELDPAIIIRRLRAEVGRLREEVKYLKGENVEEEGGYGDGDGNDDGFGLDRDQRSDLEQRVKEYVEDRNERSVLDVGTVTLTRMQYAHTILKRMLLAERSGGFSGGTSTGIGAGGSASTAVDASLKLSELERTLQRRDHEIAILVDMVKKKNGLPPTASFQRVAHLFRTSSDQRDESATTNEQEVVSADGGNSSRSSALCTIDASTCTIVEDGSQAARAIQQRSKFIVSFCGVESRIDRAIVEDPSAAFHFFRQRYPGSVSLNETKAKLKSKYQEAKDVGQIVQQSKAIINEHSRSIESLRRSRAMDGLTSGERFDQDRIMEPHPDEEEHRSAIQKEKVVYRNAISRLKELKSQIGYSQKLVEKNRLALQRDFDIWFSNVCDEGASDAIGGEGQRSSRNCTTADVPPPPPPVAAADASSMIPNSISEKSCSMTETSSSAVDEAMGAACGSLSSRSPATGTTHGMIKRSTSGQSRGTTDDGLNGGLSFTGGASDLIEHFQLPAGVKLTGNKDVDNDIVAFYKAKAELMVAKTGR